MNKVLLKNDSHIFQMLGNFDNKHGYTLPKDIAELLIKMPKKPVFSKDEIDVGLNVAFLESSCGTEFCLEGSILYFVEHATEIGGLVAFTYLTPLTEITTDYFKNLDTELDLTPLKQRIGKRRAQYVSMLTEYERLARTANRRAQKTLAQQNLPEFDELMSTAKRYVRPGKPDYCTSQLQILAYVIDKNNLPHPSTEIINRWKTACNNKTSAALLAEAPADFHIPEITDAKKDGGGNKGKKLDFKSLLAVLLKQNAPQKPPKRLKPSENAVQLLNAETEVENDFEPEEKPESPESIEKTEQLTDEEEKLQQLVAALLGKHQSLPEAKTQTKSKVSRQDIAKAHLAQHAPASLNLDHEQ